MQKNLSTLGAVLLVAVIAAWVGGVAPPAFSGVVEVAPGVLGPRHGGVSVDLVEPGHEPTGCPLIQIITRQVFRDSLPWVVITVGPSG